MIRKLSIAITSMLVALLLLVWIMEKPLLGIPGTSLSGPEANKAWPMPTEDGVLYLETNPSQPYSVVINFRAIAGEVYVDPTPDRQWFKYMTQDSRVRLRFDGEDTVYSAQAETEVNPLILKSFEPDRQVLRLIFHPQT